MSQPAETPDWRPASEALLLSSEHIDIFRTETENPADVFERYTSALTDEERERCNRLRIAAKRNESIVARGLLRLLLSRFLGQPPQSFSFAHNPHGKPRLDDTWKHRAVHFNVSHTRNLVLIAITLGREIGIDVEHPRSNISHQEIAERFFTQAESEAIAALPPADRLAAFFHCWTRKEAILKATGHGISLGLKTFGVPIAPHLENAPVTVHRVDHAPRTWTLSAVGPGPGYVAAVAAFGSEPIHVRRWFY